MMYIVPNYCTNDIHCAPPTRTYGKLIGGAFYTYMQLLDVA